MATPTQFVSTYDLISTKNSLATMFSVIDPITGSIPFCGPPLCDEVIHFMSDTYHAWAVIGVYNYFLYTGDVEFVRDVWANYVSVIDALGLSWTEFISDKGRPVLGEQAPAVWIDKHYWYC